MRSEQRLHSLSAPEKRNGLASDRNQSPCAGISSGPAFPKLHKKTPSSEACWASKVWPSVLTRAYPTIISSSTYFVSLADSWVDCCSCALICIANSCVLSQLAQSRGTSKVRCLEGFGERSHPPSSTYGSIRTPVYGPRASRSRSVFRKYRRRSTPPDGSLSMSGSRPSTQNIPKLMGRLVDIFVA